MFLQSLLHSPCALLSRYRRWLNKVSNLKIRRWFCSHCLVTWLLRLRCITGHGPENNLWFSINSRAGWFLVTSGRAGLQKCWPVPSLLCLQKYVAYKKDLFWWTKTYFHSWRTYWQCSATCLHQIMSQSQQKWALMKLFSPDHRQLNVLGLLQFFEESADLALLSRFCDDSDLRLSVFK